MGMALTRRIVSTMVSGGLVCAALNASAFLGLGEKEGKEASPSPPAGGIRLARKYHLQIPNERTEQELLNLLESKKLLRADIEALERMEKARALKAQRVQGNLRSTFGIEADDNYGFDPDDGTLYRLPSNTNEVDRVPVWRSENEQDARALLERLEHRKRLILQLRLLRQLLGEQQQQLENVEQLLNDKFSIESGRLYNYDDDEMILYEMVPPPKDPYDDR